MEQNELRQLEEQCIQECAPTCTAACPVHVAVKTMLIEIGRGDFSAALKIYRRSVPLPGVISRICDQPCREVCKRTELDEAIALRLLERACVEHGDLSGEKTRTPPQRRQQVVIIGGGVSGLTAAHDLARKGYKVLIVEATDRLGGSLWLAADGDLPKTILQRDIEAILALGIEAQYETPIDRMHLANLRRDFDAVYLASGAHMPNDFEIERDEHGTVKVDPVTFSTNIDSVFAGGGILWGVELRSAITSISEGRRAGISIDRYLQKVSLTASRINEGSYTSCLYTNTPGLAAQPLIETKHPDEGYEWHEAIQEAKRCIQCECLECVKACEYLKAFERYPRKYVREVYNNLSIVKGTRYANTFINSCSLCGLCAEVCPHDLDMGQVNLNARREMTATKRMPPSAHDFALRDMAFSNSAKFQLARNAPSTAASDYVFFPGCQLSASPPEHVEKVYADLSEHLPDNKIGLMLGCCGAPANWAGRIDLFQDTLANWRENYRALGQPKVVLACSSCYQTFKKYLPDVEIVSLWELYDQLGLPAHSEVKNQKSEITIHDPCTTRYDRSIQNKIDHTDLAQYQLRKLNETLQLAATKSRFYRQHLANLSIELTYLDDLTRLPFTTAEDLRADSLSFVCVSQDDIQRVVTLAEANFPLATLTTSGTTGQPKRLYFTRDDQALTIDFFHVGMSTLTDPGDHVLILLPGETPGSVGDLLAAALTRLGAVPIKHGPVRDATATLNVMHREKVNVLVGVPTHVLALARCPNALKSRLKAVLLSTDHVPNAIKQVIESAFDCKVYNHYGMTEMGLGGGVDCEARRGYHLREADMIFEIVDPTTGEVVPAGEYGEVVFTTLTRRGMPLVRYRTGDVSRFSTEVCPCGTALKTLEYITQRLSGRVPIGPRYLTLADLDEALFAIDGVVNFTAALLNATGRDCLHLEVQIAENRRTRSVIQAITAAVPSAPYFELRVSTVEAIPASMAKRTLLDRRKHA